MNYKVLNHLPALAHAYGVRHAVICPGSRSAPLALSFSRFKKIECISVADERSAAFMALGMAQETNSPVVLICTSGTAVLNFYPAIAEAFYRNIPLLVFTADRPAAWIDQLDGQTIRQENIFEKHIRRSMSLEETIYENEKAFDNAIDGAIRYSLSPLSGPVHINFPFSEPFYPLENESKYPTIEAKKIQTKLVGEQANLHLGQYSKPLIIVGQHPPDTIFQKQISALAEQLNCPILTDVCSNIQHPNSIQFQDILLRNEAPVFCPDLLISCGAAFTSKIVKNFLRNHPAKTHIRIYPDEGMGEPFGNVTHRMESLEQMPTLTSSDGAYLKFWQEKKAVAEKNLQDLMGQQAWSEMKAAHRVINQIPANTMLHLANSMPIRWADIFRPESNVKVYSNRGTSGIDGCTSTAMGAALASTNRHILLTGDIAFFYDINGLWQEELPSNLKIVVLNNQGGGIFRLIDGPKQQPELESLFVMKHQRQAKKVAEMYGIDYMKAESEFSLIEALPTFFEYPGLCILEIFTDPEQNGKVFESYRQL